MIIHLFLILLFYKLWYLFANKNCWHNILIFHTQFHSENSEGTNKNKNGKCSTKVCLYTSEIQTLVF